MIFSAGLSILHGCPSRRSNWPAALLALPLPFCAEFQASAETEPDPAKQIIGATATISEVSTGIPFSARIDTGAHSCSLHVVKIEIQDEDPMPNLNIGKPIRFQVKNDEGQTGWIETIITGRVRIKSSVQKGGDYQGRYKVRLTFAWKDFTKEVSVSLNDRTEMTYPLLIGRNYLHGEFLVDVARPHD